MLLLVAPQNTHAQAGIVSCASLFASGLAGSAVSSLASVPVADAPVQSATTGNLSKECLDSIAYGVANAAIQAIANSTINWINSGFEGGPTFVTDFEAFLGEVDFAAFEDFLGSDVVAFMCSPWQFDIRLMLELAFVQPTTPQCSLTDVVENIDGFLAGDFNQGGWDGWIRLTTRNNPYKDFLFRASELDSQVAAARYRETELLDWGRGFLTIEDCETRPANPGDPNANPGDTIEDCQNVLPGTLVEKRIGDVMGIDIDRLQLADEINEVIDALIVQLINQVITEGLLR
jgi:hypothetical protein